MTNTVTFNSTNPYLDPIMEVFNSDGKGKEITANNLKLLTDKLVDGKKQDEFYKKLNEFIKEAKKVVNSEKPKDKDIEGLQKKKKEIVGMVKSEDGNMIVTNQLELALDTPIACCFNISIKDSRTSSTKGFVNNFNKGLCPTTDKKLQAEETLQQIRHFCDIVKQVINTNEFEKYTTNNPDKAYEVIEENLKNALLCNEVLCNPLYQKIGTITLTFKSLLHPIINVKNEDKQTYINKSIEITTKFTELLKTACDIKNTTNKEEKIKEIGNEINKIKEDLKNLTNNDNKKQEINNRVNQQFTEIGTLITSIILNNTEATENQKEQLTWNKIYVDRANPNVAQQQDCIKAIQDINKDNSQTINKALIKEVINDEKNYEGLTKIHGTDHNDAKNEINIENDTIIISEKNKTGGNVKNDKIITISDYVINKECVDKESGKRINLLKSNDGRPTNELAALLLRISALKTTQPDAYKNATKQIANLIKEKIITEQIKDGEIIKNEFPNTPGGVVISALKNLYDTRLSITDPEEKAVGKTFGDVMVELKVLMGDKYKSDFEEKVDGLIEKSRKKVEEKKKKENEEKEAKEKEEKANEEVQKLANEYNASADNFKVQGNNFTEKINTIEKNLKEIEELKKQIEEFEKKFGENGEFALVENVVIETTQGATTNRETLDKSALNTKFETYKKELEEAKNKQKEELKETMQECKTELLKRVEELKTEAEKCDIKEYNNIETLKGKIETLEDDIDEYNKSVKEHNDILNPDGIDDNKKVKPIVSNEEGEYKNLLITIKTAEYEKKKAEEQQKQQEEEEKRKKEEEDKKLEEEKKKKEDELKDKVKEHLKTIKCKTKQQQEGGKEAEVDVEGEKEMVGNQQNIEDQIGEVGTYYSNYNLIISKLKEEDTIKELEDLGLNDGCSVAELIDVLEGFEKNVETLGSDEKYFKEDAGEDKKVKQEIFNAQKKVVENINTCFNQGIFAEEKDNIDKDSKKQTLENLIKQGQYINSLVENAKKVKEKESTILMPNQQNQQYKNTFNENLKPIKEHITIATKDEEGVVLKQILKNEIKVEEGKAKQQTIKNTETIDIDKELNTLKDDTKKLNEELLTIDEIEDKANKIKEQYKTITQELEKPDEKITSENYDEKTIEQTIEEAEVLEKEIKKFVTEDGDFKSFENQLEYNFDQDENVQYDVLHALLEVYKDKNNKIKEQIETAKKEKKEQEEQKRKEEKERKEKEEEKKIKKLVEEHTENKKKEKEEKEQKQKLIREADKDKQYIERNKDGIKSLKGIFANINEITAENLSEQNNEQQIRDNITAGEKLLEKLNKFKNDNGKYKDILNEDGVKLDENINTEEFEKALNTYKDKYKEEKKKEIEELLNKENATEQDINKAHDIFKKFEEYCKGKTDFTETVTGLKKNIKDKKKELIIQTTPELLTTKTNEVTGKVENNSRQLKTLIDNFKKDFEGVDGIDDDIKEINGKIKEHIDNLLKIDEQTQVVEEGKLQEVYDVFKEFEEELKEQEEEIEKKIKEVQAGIFDNKVVQVIERNNKEEETAKKNLEEKIKAKKEEIEEMEIKDEESKKNAETKLEELKELQKEIYEFNNGKEEEKQIKKVKVKKTDGKDGGIEEDIKVNDLEVEVNRKLYKNEKNRIETENKKINNGLDKQHSDNITTLRAFMTENNNEKKEFLNPIYKENLKKADDYLLELIQLKKDADKHDKNTINETYKEERLTGYDQSGTTNIQSNLTHKIDNIKDGIFKTHKELLENGIKTITEKHNSSKKDLENVDISKIADDNLKDNVSKINTAFDLLKEFDTLIQDIEEVDKLIEKYNTLDKSKQEERLNNQKEEVEKLKQELKISLNSKLDEINNIITSEVKKINYSEKQKNKKKQQSVDYKKLKNACLAIVQILEHKFEDKDACDVLTQEEQEDYINACMQLGWLNSLEEKESGIETSYIESFKYYTKALEVLNKDSYVDNEKDEDKKYIVEQLTKYKILTKAEKELNKAKKPIKNNSKKIEGKIKELNEGIKNIKKGKDINKRAEQILQLNITELSAYIQNEIDSLLQEKEKEKDKKETKIPQQNKDTRSTTPLESKKAEVDTDKKSSVSSPITEVNNSTNKTSVQSIQQQSITIQGMNPPPPPPLPSMKNGINIPPPPLPPLLSLKPAAQQKSLKPIIPSSKNNISSGINKSNSIKTQSLNVIDKKTELVPTEQIIENSIIKQTSNKQTEEINKENKIPSKTRQIDSNLNKSINIGVEQSKKDKQNNSNSLNYSLQVTTKPTSGTPSNKQSKNTQKQEPSQSIITNNSTTSKPIKEKSSQMTMFCMMSMFMQMMEQKKKTQELFMKNMFNNNPFYPFEKSSMMPNNYFNNPLLNNPFSPFNMWNKLNSSLIMLNSLNRFGRMGNGLFF